MVNFLVFLKLLFAHLSQRLIGELIVYPWSGHRPAVVRPCVHNVKHLLLQNHLANQSQICVEDPLVGGTKVCSGYLGHMTKKDATPIYGKNP